MMHSAAAGGSEMGPGGIDSEVRVPVRVGETFDHPHPIGIGVVFHHVFHFVPGLGGGADFGECMN
jgi:hypothetical protein